MSKPEIELQASKVSTATMYSNDDVQIVRDSLLARNKQKINGQTNRLESENKPVVENKEGYTTYITPFVSLAPDDAAYRNRMFGELQGNIETAYNANQKSQILFPIRKNGAHWVMGQVLIDKSKKPEATFLCHDPFGGGIPDADLARVVGDYFKDKGGCNIQVSNVPQIQGTIPGDGVYCGGYAIHLMNYLIQNPTGLVAPTKDSKEKVWGCDKVSNIEQRLQDNQLVDQAHRQGFLTDQGKNKFLAPDMGLREYYEHLGAADRAKNSELVKLSNLMDQDIQGLSSLDAESLFGNVWNSEVFSDETMLALYGGADRDNPNAGKTRTIINIQEALSAAARLAGINNFSNFFTNHIIDNGKLVPESLDNSVALATSYLPKLKARIVQDKIREFLPKIQELYPDGVSPAVLKQMEQHIASDLEIGNIIGIEQLAGRLFAEPVEVKVEAKAPPPVVLGAPAAPDAAKKVADALEAAKKAEAATAAAKKTKDEEEKKQPLGAARQIGAAGSDQAAEDAIIKHINKRFDELEAILKNNPGTIVVIAGRFNKDAAASLDKPDPNDNYGRNGHKLGTGLAKDQWGNSPEEEARWRRSVAVTDDRVAKLLNDYKGRVSIGNVGYAEKGQPFAVREQPSEECIHVWGANAGNWNLNENDSIGGGGQAQAMSAQPARVGVFGIVTTPFGGIDGLDKPDKMHADLIKDPKQAEALKEAEEKAKKDAADKATVEKEKKAAEDAEKVKVEAAAKLKVEQDKKEAEAKEAAVKLKAEEVAKKAAEAAAKAKPETKVVVDPKAYEKKEKFESQTFYDLLTDGLTRDSANQISSKKIDTNNPVAVAGEAKDKEGKAVEFHGLKPLEFALLKHAEKIKELEAVKKSIEEEEKKAGGVPVAPSAENTAKRETIEGDLANIKEVISVVAEKALADHFQALKLIDPTLPAAPLPPEEPEKKIQVGDNEFTIPATSTLVNQFQKVVDSQKSEPRPTKPYVGLGMNAYPPEIEDIKAADGTVTGTRVSIKINEIYNVDNGRIMGVGGKVTTPDPFHDKYLYSIQPAGENKIIISDFLSDPTKGSTLNDRLGALTAIMHAEGQITFEVADNKDIKTTPHPGVKEYSCVRSKDHVFVTRDAVGLKNEIEGTAQGELYDAEKHGASFLIDEFAARSVLKPSPFPSKTSAELVVDPLGLPKTAAASDAKAPPETPFDPTKVVGQIQAL